MNAISIKNLKKYFGKIKAVDGVSFTVEKGEIFGFLGPNGAGKTTAIRCMMDFIRPQSGEITIFDQDSRLHLSREKIGYLIAGTNLVESWTGYDHLNYQESLCGRSKTLPDLMRKFSFDPRPRVKHLSTGNRQKLGLILALMNEPQLLIMDEPTYGLDPILQEEFYKIARELTKSGATVFMSSHNLPEVEKVCTRVAMIKSGKIITVQKISALEGKRVYSVYIAFEGKVPEKDELADQNTEIIDEIADGYLISVKGAIDPFVKKTAKYKIAALQITQANLEEIFMEFYK